MKTIKAKSSKYINDHSLTPERFECQEGYGVFSYGQSQVDTVYRYVLNQAVHHQKQKFRNKYCGFLTKFKIEFDKQYIFHYLIKIWIVPTPLRLSLVLCNGLKPVVTKLFEPTALNEKN